MYSRVGTRMPPSDWMGSMKKAANCRVESWRSSGAMSPYGTDCAPGSIGPKLACQNGLPIMESAPQVKP